MNDDEFWWHSIDLGHVVTPGSKSVELLEHEWASMHLPPLDGLSVLDVGAWDGWFSFRAEREGARRVVALDYYVWSLDLPRQQRYYRECLDAGREPERYHLVPELWDPIGLPGKHGFDTARAALGSNVEPVVADFMETELGESFDVVFFLGVLYHVENPFGAIRRLRAATNRVAVIETVATRIEGHDHALCEFFPGSELLGDISNWWAPNEAALHGLCRAAGFENVETVAQPAPDEFEYVNGVAHYRTTVQAWC